MRMKILLPSKRGRSRSEMRAGSSADFATCESASRVHHTTDTAVNDVAKTMLGTAQARVISDRGWLSEAGETGRDFARVARWLALIAVLIATALIASTYPVFNQTWDEPAHIACGMEWLDKGVYKYEVQHPPLARVAVALGPYLGGLRSHGAESFWTEGNLILESNGQYQRNLTLARVGMLPFFWLCCGLIWYITHRYFGAACALASVFLFTTIPPVLAHSSLATTDMPVAAMFLLAIAAWIRWTEEPTLPNSMCLGMALGLAFLSKFSAIPFLGLTLVAAVAADRLALQKARSMARHLPAIFGAAGLTVWAAYRFSLGPLLQPGYVYERAIHKLNHIVGESGRLHNAVDFALLQMPVPAPEFFVGIGHMFSRNSSGETTYFLGHVLTRGHWWFFPILLLCKLPIPMLLLIGIGAVRTRLPRGEGKPGFLRLVLLAIICPLFLGCLSTVNHGLRYLLVILPFLAILGGIGAYELFRSGDRWASRIALFLILCNAASCWSAYPDFLSYFNELSRSHASDITVDSDIDWGQDLNRLCATLARRKDIAHLYIAYNGSADLSQFPLPSWSKLPSDQEPKGWIAISLGEEKMHPELYGWLVRYRPIQVVGSSIFLYHIE